MASLTELVSCFVCFDGGVIIPPIFSEVVCVCECAVFTDAPGILGSFSDSIDLRVPPVFGVINFFFGYQSIACAKRTGAAASVERRRYEPTRAILPE